MLDKENSAYLKKEFPYQLRAFDLGEYKLNYIDEGHGPVVLMLHACPLWIFEFRHLIQALRNQYRILAVDQLGFGLSDKPENADYHIENHVDHLDRFIHDLGVKELILVCHGRGTAIGMAFAIRHPDMIKKIVSFNTMSFSNFTLPFRLQLCRLKWLGPQLIFHLNFFQRDVKFLDKDAQFGYTLPFPNKKSKVAFLKFIEDLPCAPEEDSARTMLETESSLWLLKDKPICLIWADKDWLYKMGVLKYWQRILPEAEVHVIENAGRYLLEDAKDQVNGIVSKFLAEETPEL